MKRVYFTLTLMSLFGGLNAFAQSYTTIDGVKYGLMKDGQCVVIGDDGAKGDITFENEVEIDGGKHTVTGVCGFGNYKEVTGHENGFSENTNITGITFEEGSQIKWIGDHAFKNCSSLKTINNVPAGLTDINEWCFESTALESVDLSKTNVTIMKDGVFFNNKSLTSIQLPNKLENFWDNAFNGCTALNNIDMPSTVKGIYNSVFEGCTSLSNVTWNEGCTTLGNHVFKNCPLAAVTFPKTLGSIGEWAFEGTKLETVDLSNTQITRLPKGCFYNCQQLSDVKLPIALTDIGECAFYKSAIASITFPSSLQKIDAWAFQFTQLTNVVIPTKTGHIGDGAFSDNDNSQLSICYEDFFGERYNNLLINPYCLKMFKRRWYVLAYVPSMKIIRRFGLDRIQKIETTDNTFKYPKDFSSEDYFHDFFGMVHDAEPLTIRLKAYREKPNYRTYPFEYVSETIMCSNRLLQNWYFRNETTFPQ